LPARQHVLQKAEPTLVHVGIGEADREAIDMHDNNMRFGITYIVLDNKRVITPGRGGSETRMAEF
jgi:hypothetical protein